MHGEVQIARTRAGGRIGPRTDAANTRFPQGCRTARLSLAPVVTSIGAGVVIPATPHHRLVLPWGAYQRHEWSGIVFPRHQAPSGYVVPGFQLQFRAKTGETGDWNAGIIDGKSCLVLNEFAEPAFVAVYEFVGPDALLVFVDQLFKDRPAEDIATADWEEGALDAAWERAFPGSTTAPIPEAKGEYDKKPSKPDGDSGKTWPLRRGGSRWENRSPVMVKPFPSLHRCARVPPRDDRSARRGSESRLHGMVSAIRNLEVALDPRWIAFGLRERTTRPLPRTAGRP